MPLKQPLSPMHIFFPIETKNLFQGCHAPPSLNKGTGAGGIGPGGIGPNANSKLCAAVFKEIKFS